MPVRKCDVCGFDHRGQAKGQSYYCVATLAKELRELQKKHEDLIKYLKTFFETVRPG